MNFWILVCAKTNNKKKSINFHRLQNKKNWYANTKTIQIPIESQRTNRELCAANVSMGNHRKFSGDES
jgi:hypothetical protein